MRIKAVIFDMDGVLIEAKQWHYEALNRALGLFGYTITPSEHVTTYDGLPTRRKLEILTRDHGFPEALHAFVNEMKQIYTMEIVYRSCKPRFHHEIALSRLRSDGYTLGVASNSIRKTVDVMMEKSHLSKYLHFTLSNQDVARPKPDPEIYRKAAERARVSPCECVVVEDNVRGIEAATRAGTNVLRVESVDEVEYHRIREFIQFAEANLNTSTRAA